MEYSFLTEKIIKNTELYPLPYYYKSPPKNSNTDRRQKNQKNTYIIDYGTYCTKGGSINDNYPSLICPSKTLRTKRNDINFSVSGNDIDINYMKINPKNVFESNSKLDSKLFEDFNDYLFNELKIKKNDRLIYTEPLGVNRKFREISFELFFECYELSEIQLAVDAIAASYKILKDNNTTTSLIISLSDNKTTILPFVNSNLKTNLVRTMDIGISKMKNTMMKLFSLKYDNFQNYFIPNAIDGFFEREGFFAYDYKSQLRLYKNLEYYQKNDKLFLEDLDTNILNHLQNPVCVKYFRSHYDIEQKRLEDFNKKRRRQEQGKKLLVIREIKRKEKKEKNDKLLNDLKFLEDRFNLGDSFESLKNEVEEVGCLTKDDVLSKLRKLKIKMGLLSKEEIERSRYNLCDISDRELSPHSIKKKRYQVMLKKNSEKRTLIRKKKNEEKARIEGLKKTDLNKYISELKQRRKRIKTKIKQIKQYKNNSKLKKQKENKMIENLDNYLEGTTNTVENIQLNNFYKKMIDMSSDFEIYEEKIIKLNEEIKELDKNFDEDDDNDDLLIYRKFNNLEKVYIGTDIIRSTESLFRPYLIGNMNQGIIENIYNILKNYDIGTIKNILSNVFVIGGGAHLKGLKERLEYELFLRFSGRGVSKVKVESCDGAMVLPFLGIKEFYNDYLKEHGSFFYTREEYEEYGVNLFKSYPIGNL